MNILKTSATVFAVPLALLPLPVLAHPGHMAGHSAFVSGMLHPLTGVDHLAAMVMVGLWAGVAMRDKLWIAPLLFLASALGGYGFALSGFVLPLVEPIIIASLLMLGAGLASRKRMSAGIALSLIGLFGFAHGQAHGTEMADHAFAMHFAAGFLCATALLHAIGIAAARVASANISRIFGLLGMGLGIFLVTI